MSEETLKKSNEIIDLYESVSGEVLWKQNQVAIVIIIKLASEIEPHLLPLVSNFLIENYVEKWPPSSLVIGNTLRGFIPDKLQEITPLDLL